MNYREEFEKVGLFEDKKSLDGQARLLAAQSLGLLLAEITELTDRRVGAVIDGIKLDEREIALFEELKTAFDGGGEVPPETMCGLLQKRADLREDLPECGAVTNALRVLSSRGDGVENDGLWRGMTAYFTYRTYPYAYAALRCRMRIVASFDEKKWLVKIKRKLGSLADEAIDIQKRTGHNDAENTQKRIDRAFEKAVELINLLHEVPDLMPHFERFGTYCEGGNFARFENYGVVRKDMKDALRYGRELSSFTDVTTLLRDMERIREASADATTL